MNRNRFYPNTDDPIGVAIAEMRITCEFEFIPWSKSRNSKEKFPSFNYKATLKKNGKEVITTDYMMGCGHSPNYKQNNNSYDYRKKLQEECERGVVVRLGGALGGILPTKIKIVPEVRDVLYSLLMDKLCANNEFEDFCADFGYDTDSRKAENIYNELVNISNKLYRNFSSHELEILEECFRDY